ncbi:cell wall hydrolase [Novosphingobium sp. 1949]|uniref:Cell wall hydrolase n=1 Tax=Novosphingobium organovorum TaxID=2930092 RepID=A0ABT0BE09_9SPHN|nr:cell wall hydrolase [Novosphingobium organovorum]MCJ2183295.1 cell wall hydrolase [Novosphingobium organovorum]
MTRQPTTIDHRIDTLARSITQACAQAEGAARRRPLPGLFGTREAWSAGERHAPGTFPFAPPPLLRGPTPKGRPQREPARRAQSLHFRPTLPVLTFLQACACACALALAGSGHHADGASAAALKAPDTADHDRFPAALADLPARPDAAPPSLDISADTARRLNAATPFVAGPVPAASAFRFTGDAASLARARDCLASAQYYEAGFDLEGQRAVAQVVLNRVRHPAYPNSVCAVVYQGAERHTGCQFTFTCDGAMERSPIASLWREAQGIADEALHGAIYAPVGWATHYHTDWVRPAWSGELDKIAKVHTHIFFRWKGGWGRAAAFSQRESSSEPFEPRLARYALAHRGADPREAEAGVAPTSTRTLSTIAPQTAALRAEEALPGVNLRGSTLALVHPQGDAFGFLLPSAYPGAFGLLALDVCRGRAFCKVMGWTDPAALPAGFPIPQVSRARMAFLFIYDRNTHHQMIGWNCDLFPRTDPAECLTPRATRWDAIARADTSAR